MVKHFASLTPEASALTVRGKTYSYEQLAVSAEKLSEVIRATFGSGKRIGVIANRDASAYMGLLSTLGSGNAYVPLSPTHPAARNEQILDTADISAIITRLEDVHHIRSELNFGGPVITIDADLAYTLFCDGQSIERPAESDGTAYILFTSGSTGTPKGVPITHSNIMAYFEHCASRYCLTPQDRIAQVSELTFDLSVFDMIAAWGSGACLCVMQAIEIVAPARFINTHKISVWLSVPSVISLLLRSNALEAESFPTLRWSLFCGEPLYAHAAEAWALAAPNSSVENLYGPTELTVSCAVYAFERASHNRDLRAALPIGLVHASLAYFIADEGGNPVTAGESGELCVTGPQKFVGYWRNPEASRKAHFKLGQTEYYRTGDRMRTLPDGSLCFLGRLDDQVKINGYRVELGEIEAWLIKAPGIEQCAAVAGTDTMGVSRITAYATGTFDYNQVVGYMKTKLPVYMIPHEVVALEKLPLNSNGKIDRPSLRSWAIRSQDEIE
ncbi:amino acid adenylation domain-containing protein [Rhizobium changzhiense]|uniref:amino acid adenylation domain-containing protein n=1 Tax=Rhizobium changzhiense TaxID=2692317 RepID=UPI001F0CD9E1|nr:amino acid adenylation domain-containing protein [Rhizobium changzhiense]